MFDNRDQPESRAAQASSLLMATRRGLPEHTGEAEPVMIDRYGDSIILTLDDGEQLVFDALELSCAVKPFRRVAL